MFVQPCLSQHLEICRTKEINLYTNGKFVSFKEKN